MYALCFTDDLSQYNEDNTYGTIRSVMTASIARDHYRLFDVHEQKRLKSKKKQQRKDSEGSLKLNLEKRGRSKDRTPASTANTSKASSSRTTGSPRSHLPREPTDHHLKTTHNEKLKEWLKEKDARYREARKEERQKRRAERQKKMIERTEKEERKQESDTRVDKWMKIKKKEAKKKQRENSRSRKLQDSGVNQQTSKSYVVPGTRKRPQSAPANREFNGIQNGYNGNLHVNSGKPDLDTDGGAREPHPPNSKFIYKRPVSGRIKLNIQKRPQSASVGNSKPADMTIRNSRSTENINLAKEQERKKRMSYDDWVSQKRKLDERKKELVKKQKEELAKSDPELARIVPGIAKKRIHRVLEGKKSIDTGMKKVDKMNNQRFGGSDYESEGESTQRSTSRNSYRLESERTGTGRVPNPDVINIHGQGINAGERPKTAPPTSMPTPKQSVNSPRKAALPSNSERSSEVSTGYSLPFPAEKGVPKHVASRQRHLFAEKMHEELSSIEKEGKSEIQKSNQEEKCLTIENSSNLNIQSKITSPDSKSNPPKDMATSQKEETTLVSENSQNSASTPQVKDTNTASTPQVKDTNTASTPQAKDTNTAPTIVLDEKCCEEEYCEEEYSSDSEAQTSSDQEGEDLSARADTGDLEDEANLEAPEVEETEPNPQDGILKNSTHELPGQEAADERQNTTLEGEVDVSMQTSRSMKHVSFSEENQYSPDQPEDNDPGDWSTDTATPDEEQYTRSEAANDLDAEVEGHLESDLKINDKKDILNSEVKSEVTDDSDFFATEADKKKSEKASDQTEEEEEEIESESRSAFLTDSIEEDF